jgi:hypothetical protein
VEGITGLGVSMGKLPVKIIHDQTPQKSPPKIETVDKAGTIGEGLWEMSRDAEWVILAFVSMQSWHRCC